MQLIDQYTQGKVDEAKLDGQIEEHNLVMKWWSKPGVGDIKFGSWSAYRRAALANLKAQLADRKEKK